MRSAGIVKIYQAEFFAAAIAVLLAIPDVATAQGMRFPSNPRTTQECHDASNAADEIVRELIRRQGELRRNAGQARRSDWRAGLALDLEANEVQSEMHRVMQQRNEASRQCMAQALAFQRSQDEARALERAREREARQQELERERERQRVESQRRRFRVPPSEPGFAAQQRAEARSRSSLERVPVTAGRAVLDGAFQSRLDAFARHGITNIFGNVTSRGPVSPRLTGAIAALDIMNILQGDGGPGAALFGPNGARVLALGTMAVGEAAGWNPLQRMLVGGSLAVLLQLHTDATRDLQNAFRAFDARAVDARYRQRVEAIEMRDTQLRPRESVSAQTDNLRDELERTVAALGDVRREREMASSAAMAEARAARAAREAAQREAEGRNRAAQVQQAREQEARRRVAWEEEERLYELEQERDSRRIQEQMQADRDALMRAIADGARAIMESRSRSSGTISPGVSKNCPPCRGPGCGCW